MICSKFDCHAACTHALIIWSELLGRMEAHPRCENHGRADVKHKLVQKVGPSAKTKLVKL